MAINEDIKKKIDPTSITIVPQKGKGVWVAVTNKVGKVHKFFSGSFSEKEVANSISKIPSLVGSTFKILDDKVVVGASTSIQFEKPITLPKQPSATSLLAPTLQSQPTSSPFEKIFSTEPKISSATYNRKKQLNRDGTISDILDPINLSGIGLSKTGQYQHPNEQKTPRPAFSNQISPTGFPSPLHEKALVTDIRDITNPSKSANYDTWANNLRVIAYDENNKLSINNRSNWEMDGAFVLSKKQEINEGDVFYIIPKGELFSNYLVQYQKGQFIKVAHPQIKEEEEIVVKNLPTKPKYTSAERKVALESVSNLLLTTKAIKTLTGDYSLGLFNMVGGGIVGDIKSTTKALVQMGSAQVGADVLLKKIKGNPALANIFEKNLSTLTEAQLRTTDVIQDIWLKSISEYWNGEALKITISKEDRDFIKNSQAVIQEDVDKAVKLNKDKNAIIQLNGLTEFARLVPTINKQHQVLLQEQTSIDNDTDSLARLVDIRNKRMSDGVATEEEVAKRNETIAALKTSLDSRIDNYTKKRDEFNSKYASPIDVEKRDVAAAKIVTIEKEVDALYKKNERYFKLVGSDKFTNNEAELKKIYDRYRYEMASGVVIAPNLERHKQYIEWKEQQEATWGEVLNDAAKFVLKLPLQVAKMTPILLGGISGGLLTDNRLFGALHQFTSNEYRDIDINYAARILTETSSGAASNWTRKTMEMTAQVAPALFSGMALPVVSLLSASSLGNTYEYAIKNNIPNPELYATISGASEFASEMFLMKVLGRALKVKELYKMNDFAKAAEKVSIKDWGTVVRYGATTERGKILLRKLVADTYLKRINSFSMGTGGLLEEFGEEISVAAIDALKNKAWNEIANTDLSTTIMTMKEGVDMFSKLATIQGFIGGIKRGRREMQGNKFKDKVSNQIFLEWGRGNYAMAQHIINSAKKDYPHLASRYDGLLEAVNNFSLQSLPQGLTPTQRAALIELSYQKGILEKDKAASSSDYAVSFDTAIRGIHKEITEVLDGTSEHLKTIDENNLEVETPIILPKEQAGKGVGGDVEAKDVVYHGVMVNDAVAFKKQFPPVHPNEFYHHSTIEFKPKNKGDIEVGKKENLKVVGRLTTDKVDVLLVENPKSKNKDAHITLSTAEGVNPFESNKEIENNRDKIVPITDGTTISGTEGYFNGSEDITKATQPEVGSGVAKTKAEFITSIKDGTSEDLLVSGQVSPLQFVEALDEHNLPMPEGFDKIINNIDNSAEEQGYMDEVETERFRNLWNKAQERTGIPLDTEVATLGKTGFVKKAISIINPKGIKVALDHLNSEVATKGVSQSTFKKQSERIPQEGAPNSIAHHETDDTHFIVQYNKTGTIDALLSIPKGKGVLRITGRYPINFTDSIGASLLESAMANGIDIVSNMKNYSFTNKVKNTILKWVFRRARYQPKGFESTNAMVFIEENLERLVDTYLNNTEDGKSGKIDPDNIRIVLSKVGYTGVVPVFKDAGNLLVDTIYNRMLSNKKNKTITFLTGLGGSGKGTILPALKLKSDITYDSAFNSFEDLNYAINKAKAAGMKVTVVFVYNDMVSTFQNTVDRGIKQRKNQEKGVRFLNISYFEHSANANKGKVAKIKKHHPNIETIAVDNSGNRGRVKKVTIKEALKWRYDITPQQTQELLEYVAEKINSKDILIKDVPAITEGYNIDHLLSEEVREAMAEEVTPVKIEEEQQSEIEIIKLILLPRLKKSFLNISSVILVSAESMATLIDELNAISTDSVYMLLKHKDGKTEGFAYKGVIYLNKEVITANITFEEAGHIWTQWVKYHRADLYKAGLSKVVGSKYLSDVSLSAFYKEQALQKGKEGSDAYNTYLMEEALAKAIADKGESFVGASKKSDFKQWVAALWRAIAKEFGIRNLTPTQISELSLNEFAEKAAADIFSKGRGLEVPSSETQEVKHSRRRQAPVPLFGLLLDIDNISEEDIITLTEALTEVVKNAEKPSTGIAAIKEAMSTFITALGSRITLTQGKIITQKIPRALNAKSPVVMGRYVRYIANVLKDSKYPRHLKMANVYKKRVKALFSKANKSGRYSSATLNIVYKFLLLEPIYSSDITKYTQIAESIITSLKAIRVQAPTPTSSINVAEIESYLITQFEEQERIKIIELKKRYASFIRDNSIDTNVDYNELKRAIAEATINNTPPSDEVRNIAIQYYSEEIALFKDVIKGIIATRIDPVSGEEIHLTSTEIESLTQLLSIDTSSLSFKDLIFLSKGLSEFITNYTMGGLEKAIYTSRGATESLKIKEEKIVASPIGGLGFIENIWYSNIATINFIFKRLWGRAQSSRIMKSMGWSDLQTAGAKMEISVRKTMDAYNLKFKNTKPNGLSFINEYNVYMRNMYAYMYRNIIGSEKEQKEEYERRLDNVLYSIELYHQNSDTKDMAEILTSIALEMGLYKEGVTIENINDYMTDNQLVNRESVIDWIKIHNETSDARKEVALNHFNILMDFDINYTTDTYYNIDMDMVGADLNELSPLDYTGRASTAVHKVTDRMSSVFIKMTYPKLRKQKEKLVLDFKFERNNERALRSALIDINGARYIAQINGFITSPSFKSIMPSIAERDMLFGEGEKAGLIHLYINHLKKKGTHITKAAVKASGVVNFVAKLAAQLSLIQFAMPAKQALSVLVTTLVKAKTLRLDLFLRKDVREWINNSSEDIATRGLSSQLMIDDYNSLMGKIERGGSKSIPLKFLTKAAGAVLKDMPEGLLEISVKYPDVFSARLSYITYYMQYMKNIEGINHIENWATHIENRNAAQWARGMVNEAQGESDRALTGRLFSTKDVGLKTMVAISMPFATILSQLHTRMYLNLHLINRAWLHKGKHRTIKDAARLTKGEGTYAAVDLGLVVGEIWLFTEISLLFGGLANQIVSQILYGGFDDDDRDEIKKAQAEKFKQKQLLKRRRNMISDLLAPLPPFTPVIATLIDDFILKPYYERNGIEKDSDEYFLLLSTFEKSGVWDDLGLLGIAPERGIAVKKYLTNDVDSKTGVFKDVGAYSARDMVLYSDEDLALYNNMRSIYILGTSLRLPREITSIAERVMDGLKKRALPLNETDYHKQKLQGVKKEAIPKIKPFPSSIRTTNSNILGTAQE